MRRTVLFTLLLGFASCGTAAEPVRVGSKKFTESVVLGELATQRLDASGISSLHRRELGGTRVLWEALLRGDLDVYPEYTGTLRLELLPGEATSDEAALAKALSGQGLKMSPPLGFQNTYALGMKQARAAELGIRTLSELASRRDVRLGFSNEFLDRADGWPALRRRYGFQSTPRGLDHDLAYRALASGELDVTDLYSTDAEIRQLGLVVLEDDLHHFPEYAAVLLYRADLPKPAEAALLSLSGSVTQEQMISMNAAVRVSGRSESQVAADFLLEHFGIRAHATEAGLAGRLLTRTREHLTLVAVSLGLALLVSIPLGVVAARRRRWGRVLLSGAGVLQTVPSLALLVFMIPLLGIGMLPAIAALFLYSLLPILRGTHGGLTSLPPELEDSAEALGLTPAAKLLHIQFPLAAPSILSGIKTAAVINVGTATLGALIGAGGYGQPILTGIRLADVGLILEGAIPAALLALLVQGAFDLLERVITPRAMRGTGR